MVKTLNIYSNRSITAMDRTANMKEEVLFNDSDIIDI